MSSVAGPYDRAVILQRLTAERLRSYYAVCDDDPALTFALYEWNIAASSAALGLAAMVEVVVRNALDQQLLQWAERRSKPWFDLVPVDQKGKDDIATARRRARRPGKRELHGKVIAELNLGFWRYLVASRYLTTLWTPALHKAFPYGHKDVTTRRAEVEERLQRLAFVRNRAAHHEPIHRRDLLTDHEAAVELVGWICPDSARWIDLRSGVPGISAVRPIRLP